MALRLYGDGNIENVTSINTAISSTELGYLDGVTGDILVDPGVWTTYTPSWTNLTLGNATQEWYYIKIGKIVFVKGFTTLGSTSSVGSQPKISLPVNARSVGNIANLSRIGQSVLRISGTSYLGDVYYQTETEAGFYRLVVSGTNLAHNTVTSTTPATWSAGDIFLAQFSYEAA